MPQLAWSAPLRAPAIALDTDMGAFLEIPHGVDSGQDRVLNSGGDGSKQQIGRHRETVAPPVASDRT